MPPKTVHFVSGDLKQSLLDTALVILGSGDASSLSLRGLARQLGVSTAAPYHHFRDRNALLLEIALEGHNRLFARLNLARTKGATTEERATALTRAYLKFAKAEPGYHRAMYLPEIVELKNNPDVLPATIRNFELVCKFISESMGTEPGLARNTAVSIVALLHGITTLRDSDALDFYLQGTSDETLAITTVLGILEQSRKRVSSKPAAVKKKLAAKR